MINIDRMDDKTELEKIGFKNGEVDFDEQIADLEKPHIDPNPEPAPPAMPPDEEVDEAIAIDNNTVMDSRLDGKAHVHMVAIVCGLVGLLVVAVIGGSLLAVAKIQDTYDGPDNEPATNDTPKQEESIVEENNEEKALVQEVAPVSEIEVERFIGSEELGFLKVETYWRQISLADSAITNRAIYENGNYYITMADSGISAKTPSALADEWRAKLEIESAESVEQGVVDMGGILASQLKGYYREQNIWTITWFFKTEDGHLRYIAMEGPSKTNKFFAIPNTYRLKK